MVDATREMIIACQDIDLVKLTVPGWKDNDGNNFDVYIKQFSVEDGEDCMNNTSKDGQMSKEQKLKGIIVSVCDKDGNRLFNKDDVDALYKKNFKIVLWLANEIANLNFKPLENIEEQAKN